MIFQKSGLNPSSLSKEIWPHPKIFWEIKPEICKICKICPFKIGYPLTWPKSRPPKTIHQHKFSRQMLRYFLNNICQKIPTKIRSVLKSRQCWIKRFQRSRILGMKIENRWKIRSQISIKNSRDHRDLPWDRSLWMWLRILKIKVGQLSKCHIKNHRWNLRPQNHQNTHPRLSKSVNFRSLKILISRNLRLRFREKVPLYYRIQISKMEAILAPSQNSITKIAQLTNIKRGTPKNPKS